MGGLRIVNLLIFGAEKALIPPIWGARGVKSKEGKRLLARFNGQGGQKPGREWS